MVCHREKIIRNMLSDVLRYTFVITYDRLYDVNNSVYSESLELFIRRQLRGWQAVFAHLLVVSEPVKVLL